MPFLCCWFLLILLICAVFSILRCPFVRLLRFSLLLFFYAAVLCPFPLLLCVLLCCAMRLPCTLLQSALLCFSCSSPACLCPADEGKTVFIHNFCHIVFHIRPHYPENTASRPICEVKQGQVRLVLAWGTSWEVRMLYIFFAFFLLLC